MALSLTPTTELEAVNIMLTSIGEQPVNTLESGGVSEVSIARTILHQTSRQVQEVGLRFNKETEYSLAKSPDDTVSIPSNALRVDPSDYTKDYVVRGSRLYDRENHTYEFDEAVKVDIVFFLTFTDLPQAAREYITIRAARIFQTRVLGSETLHAFTLSDEQQAFLALMRQEIDSADYNVFRSSPYMQQALRRW